MKKILFLALTLTFTIAASAQNAIDNHFSYMLDDDNTTNINITGKMFQLLNSIEVESDSEDMDELKEMQDFIGSVDAFQMIVGKELTGARSKYDTGSANLANEYDELVSVVDKEGRFLLYVNEHQGVVSEIVGIGTDNESLMVFSFSGEMELKQVGKVIKHIESADFGQARAMENVDPSKVTIFPNPASASGSVTMELPTAMEGGVVKMHDANGTLVKEFDVDSTKQCLQLTGIDAGTYTLRVSNDGVTVTKKIVVIN